MDPVTCPSCRRIANASTLVIGDSPEPVAGDRSICLYCLAVMVFTGDGVRRMTEAEEIESLFDRRLHEARVAASTFRGLL